MAHFFELQNRLTEVTWDYFQNTQTANDKLGEEMKAVIKCQSFYRACKVRERWHSVVDATLLIQRCCRGWLARLRTREKKATAPSWDEHGVFPPLRIRRAEVL